MASSEKKRARERNAAARRDRVAQKRIEKSEVPSGTSDSPWTVREETPEQSPEAARPEGREA
jgi:hypothetical protein